jgi:hypothetical protein
MKNAIVLLLLAISIYSIKSHEGGCGHDFLEGMDDFADIANSHYVHPSERRNLQDV